MKINSKSSTGAEALAPGVERRLLAEDSGYTLTHMRGEPGEGAPPHAHPHQQVIYVLEGAGVFRVGEETRTLEAGDTVAIPAGEAHTFDRFLTEMEWLEFFSPRREDIRPVGAGDVQQDKQRTT